MERIVKQEGIKEGKIKTGLFMECLHCYGQMSQTEIGEKIGGVGYSRVSQLRKRLREELQKDTKLKEIFNKIERTIIKD